MRTFAIVILTALAVSQPYVAAGAQLLGVYADQVGADCDISDTVPGLLTVYVVQHAFTPVRSMFFRATKPACMTGAEWLSDTPGDIAVLPTGDSQGGMTVIYSGCRTGAIFVLAINYFGFGMSEPCCEYWIWARVSASGCTPRDDCILDSCATEISVVNGDGSCPCPATVGVEAATWGQIKALYRR